MTEPAVNHKISIPFVDSDYDRIPWSHPGSGIQPRPNNLSRTFAETCTLLRIAKQIMEVMYAFCISRGIFELI